MSTPAFKSPADPDATDVLNTLEPGASKSIADAHTDDVAEGVETVAIELNFNAFADHVPPTQHARRAARYTDPSVQDFADQALELATLRAELKRLTREHDVLQNSMHSREVRLQRSHDELVSTRSQLERTMLELREAASKLATHAPGSPQGQRPQATAVASPVAAPVPVAPPPVAAPAQSTKDRIVADGDVSDTVELSAPEIEASVTQPDIPPFPATKVDASATRPDVPPLPATKVDASATRTDIPPLPATNAAPPTSERRLVPVDGTSDPIFLTRDIITIGRTRSTDVCIASAAVSRDHARLLVGPRIVTIIDMDSANGCFVNDEPVKRHHLREGDIVRIGDRSYRFTNGTKSA